MINRKFNNTETVEAEIKVMMLPQRACIAENRRKTNHQMDR